MRVVSEIIKRIPFATQKRVVEEMAEEYLASYSPGLLIVR